MPIAIDGKISRRMFAGLTLAAATAPASAWAALGDPGDYNAATHLQARVRKPGEAFVEDPRTPGIRPLGLDKRRDAMLFTPPGIDFAVPVPLVVALHAKDGVGFDGLKWFKAQATARKFLVVTPVSRGPTWTIDDGPVGVDEAFIDKTLDWVFSRFPIDPAHIAIAGFADGATYALSTGLQNGDKFSDIMAFAPLNYIAPNAVGRPRLYLGIGRGDQIVSQSSVEHMGKTFQGQGYDVVVDVNPAGHVVADVAVKAAVARFLPA
ncbi:MAG: phospholipase/Carboxylesterase [Caulobacter sp.]|nr:phospholipase/Carboxylesterase [Caulobacter sp.]